MEPYLEQDQYNSELYYDYYDDEPLEELWDEDSLTDMAVDELTENEIIRPSKEVGEASTTDPEAGFAFELAPKPREMHIRKTASFCSLIDKDAEDIVMSKLFLRQHQQRRRRGRQFLVQHVKVVL